MAWHDATRLRGYEAGWLTDRYDFGDHLSDGLLRDSGMEGMGWDNVGHITLSSTAGTLLTRSL